MFEFIQMAETDPVFGLSDIYNSDTRKNKINLGIGVYIDELGNTPILRSVKNAEKWLLKNEKTKNYLSIGGISSFNSATQTLLFGTMNSIISNKYIGTVQTPGGTGALRISAEFVKKNTNAKRIWISNPSWINHKNIFLATGLEVHNYPYYNYNTHEIDFRELVTTLEHLHSEDIVVFHCCCHNPTGMDFNLNQWNILSQCSKDNQWVPLFDLAYQGFSNGLSEDLEGLHIFCKNNSELIICNSYSKNFGLYNERVGACTVMSKQNNIENILSQLRATIRSNYSNPPSHGAAIVSLILNSQSLREIWMDELKNMRENINSIRKLFLNTLKNHNNYKKNCFDFIEKQRGMFAFMGLNKQQVNSLREQTGIYLVDSGRINLAGISKNNIKYVSDSIMNNI